MSFKPFSKLRRDRGVIRSVKHFAGKVGSKLPLRIVLIVPFVLQIVGTVGLVGYFSFINGQQTVNNLTAEMRRELTSRIEDKLKTYTETPHAINRLNASAFAQGNIDVDNAKGEYPFWQQIEIFPSTSFVYCGSERGGEIFGVGRLAGENSLQVLLSNASTGDVQHFYQVDLKGNRTQLVGKDTRIYDSRIRPWYKVAVAAGQASWSEIYLDFTTKLPTVTASLPVYNTTDNSLRGVCATDLYLPQEMSQFLKSLKIGKTGSAFIMERSGLLMSTSTKEPMTVGSGESAKRLPATESGNPTVRATAVYLRDRFGDFQQLQVSQQLDFSMDGKRQLVQVLPFKDNYGLDWLIVIVIPEADFMEQIYENTRITILLSIAALIISILICILTTRWITRPILSLNQSAKALTKGEWEQTVKIERSDDLGELAKSFNSMAHQLQASFTQMQTLNEALSQSESQLKQFLEAMPVGVVIYDATGQIYYLNRMAQQSLGGQMIPGVTLDQLIDVYPIYRAGTEQLYPNDQLSCWRALRGEPAHANDIELHYSDQIIPLETFSTPVFDETGKVVYAITVFTDITERKQAEKLLADYNRTLEQQVAERTVELEREIVERKRAEEAAYAANRAKSTFLANMSHELRTPLNAILGFSQLMNRPAHLLPEQGENLSIIIRNGEHLLTLINQVLNLSKIEAGRITFNPTNFDLYRLLDDLENMFQLKANNQGLQLRFDLNSDVPQHLYTDEVKLRQVLINLLSNAIKFTKEGRVSVRVRAVMANGKDSSNYQLHFEVEDTGSGIAPDELDSLFEPFVQTQAGQQLQEGTGLGLTIARSFVQLMGGEMSVSSQVGHGSVFKFNISVSSAEPAQLKSKQPTRRVVGFEPNQPCYRILVVDDQWDNRQLLIKLLSPLGFELREASNGEEAIAIWSEWRSHLIFMDIRMPVLDGMEATKRIRATANRQDVAIVAVTASSLEEERANVLSVGCDDYIRKPFKEEHIFDVMHKQIGVRFIYEELAAIPNQTQTEANVLTPSALAILPANLVANLYQAVLDLDVKSIQSAIAEIGKHNPSLANDLAILASKYQYEQLLELTEILHHF